MRVPIGTDVRFKVTFRDPTGTLVDPTTVSFRIKPPGMPTVVLVYPTDITRESLGVFVVVYTLNIANTWRARFEGTGALDAASPDIIVLVDPTYT